MGAGEGLGVAAAEVALGAGVVAGGGADGIGGLLGDGAAGAAAHPAPARRFRLFGAHAGDQAGVTEATGRHRVAGGDGLGDGAVGSVFVLLVEVAVFGPEGRRDRLTPGLVDDIIWGRGLNLRLPASSRRVLRDLRARGWKLGVLTNGDPEVQARKVDALGLSAYVDAIVFAAEHGSGKPSPTAFYEVARRLHVMPSRTIVVGDDEWCDVNGARMVGMRPVRFIGHRHWPPGPSAADLVLTRISDLPGAAAALLADQRGSHAA